jgi:hypothetical protein
MNLVKRLGSLRKACDCTTGWRAELTKVAAAAFVVFVLGVCQAARATDFTWVSSGGSDGGDFNDPPHWSPTGPPTGATSNADIGLAGAGAYSVSVTVSPSFGGLTLDAPNATLDERAQNFATASDSDIIHGKVILTGTLWKNGGGAITQTITIEAAATLSADSLASIHENFTNSGTVEVNGSLTFDATTVTTNKSTFTVKSAATLNITGSTFTQSAGAFSISSAGTAALTSGGVFNYNGGSVDGLVSCVGTSKLNIGAGAGGGGSFNFQFINNTLTGNVLMGQLITVESTNANGVASLAWTTSGFSNAGQIILTSSGTSARNSSLSVATGNTLTNTGEMDFQAGVGGTRFLTTDALNNSGTLNVNAPTNMDRSSSALTNSGHIHIASGSSLTLSNFGSFTQTAGDSQDDGTLAVTPSSGDIKIQGGILHGTGSVTGKLQVSGTGQIAPGDSIGTLSVTGNTSFSGGSLAVELGATGSPGTSDLLAITGNLTLSGSSALGVSGGAASGYYTIVTYSGSLSGTFSSITAGYAADYSHSGQIRIVSTPLPGDYNNNGIVDAADYVVWRKAGATDYLPNDITPGTVNASDYTVWRAHFGQSAGGGSEASAHAAVPEPTTLALLMFAAMGVFSRRRSRR